MMVFFQKKKWEQERIKNSIFGIGHGILELGWGDGRFKNGNDIYVQIFFFVEQKKVNETQRD